VLPQQETMIRISSYFNAGDVPALSEKSFFRRYKNRLQVNV